MHYSPFFSKIADVCITTISYQFIFRLYFIRKINCAINLHTAILVIQRTTSNPVFVLGYYFLFNLEAGGGVRESLATVSMAVLTTEVAYSQSIFCDVSVV